MYNPQSYTVETFKPKKRSLRIFVYFFFISESLAVLYRFLAGKRRKQIKTYLENIMQAADTLYTSNFSSCVNPRISKASSIIIISSASSIDSTVT